MNLSEEKKAPLRNQGDAQKKTMLAMQFKSAIQVLNYSSHSCVHVFVLTKI